MSISNAEFLLRHRDLLNRILDHFQTNPEGFDGKEYINAFSDKERAVIVHLADQLRTMSQLLLRELTIYYLEHGLSAEARAMPEDL